MRFIFLSKTDSKNQRRFHLNNLLSEVSCEISWHWTAAYHSFPLHSNVNPKGITWKTCPVFLVKHRILFNILTPQRISACKIFKKEHRKTEGDTNSSHREPPEKTDFIWSKASRVNCWEWLGIPTDTRFFSPLCGENIDWLCIRLLKMKTR